MADAASFVLTKAGLRKQLRALLAPHGFHADGNYLRRQAGTVAQALYLQPSRYGHHYYPEMLVTFGDLGAGRSNRQLDCHVRARLSSVYHPDGDPRETPRREWTVHYDISEDRAREQDPQLAAAVPHFLAWLAELPDWPRAVERMEDRRFGTWCHGHLLFEDLGRPVPRPR